MYLYVSVERSRERLLYGEYKYTTITVLHEYCQKAHRRTLVHAVDRYLCCVLSRSVVIRLPPPSIGNMYLYRALDYFSSIDPIVGDEYAMQVYGPSSQDNRYVARLDRLDDLH